jgi:hypothetical protein
MIQSSPTSSQSVPQRKPTTLSTTSLTELKARDIAETYTVLESQIMLAIKPSELLGQAWTKGNKKVTSPNVLAWIDWFTQVFLVG